MIDRPWKVALLRRRDGDLCHLCGAPMAFPVGTDPRNDWSATLDHLVPVAHGGTDELQNLKLAHYSCNVRRGTEPYR